MKLTAGHDCIATGCEGLALFGMKVGEQTRWACRAHQTLIGYSQQPAGRFAATAEAGPQAARLAPPVATPSQGRLL